MTPSPLTKCRVLYLGTALPTLTKDGLRGIQQPLDELVFGVSATQTDEGGGEGMQGAAPSRMRGVDCWCSVWSNGMLVEYVDVPPKGAPPKIFHPIASLHFCAAVRYAPSPDACGSERASCDEDDSTPPRYLPIDSPYFMDHPTRFDYPPLFVCVMRRTHGLKVLECHAFVCKTPDAALEFCVRAKEAFLDCRKLFSPGQAQASRESQNLGSLANGVLDRNEECSNQTGTTPAGKVPPLPPPRDQGSPPSSFYNASPLFSNIQSPSDRSLVANNSAHSEPAKSTSSPNRRASMMLQRQDLSAAGCIERALENELHISRRDHLAGEASRLGSSSSSFLYSESASSPFPSSESPEAGSMFRDGLKSQETATKYSCYESSPIMFSPLTTDPVANGHYRSSSIYKDCDEISFLHAPQHNLPYYGTSYVQGPAYLSRPASVMSRPNGFTSLRRGITSNKIYASPLGTIPGQLQNLNEAMTASVVRYQFKSWGESLNTCGREYKTYAEPEIIYVPINRPPEPIYGKGSVSKLKKKDRKNKKLAQAADMQQQHQAFINSSSLANSMMALPQAVHIYRPQFNDGVGYHYSTTARKRVQPSSTLSLFGPLSNQPSQDLMPSKARTPDKILGGSSSIEARDRAFDIKVSLSTNLPAPNSRGIYKRNMTLNEKSFAYSIREGISSHYDIYGSMPRLANDSYRRYTDGALGGKQPMHGPNGPPPEPKIDYGDEGVVSPTTTTPPKAPPLPPSTQCGGNNIKSFDNKVNDVKSTGTYKTSPPPPSNASNYHPKRATVNGVTIDSRAPHIHIFGIDKRDLKAKLQNGLRPVAKMA